MENVMSELARISIALGCAIAVPAAWCTFAPRSAREFIRGFPRSVVAAWILTAIGLCWAAWLIFRTYVGRFGVPLVNTTVDFEKLKPLLFLLTPALFFLMVRFMDELLAPRALGGLFLLVPAPLLAAARWHSSQLRLVVVVFAYAMAITGIALILSPYLFRKMSRYWIENDANCRLLGGAGLAFGILVIVLGATAY